MYGWMPLYIIKAGEPNTNINININTNMWERSFNLHFYLEKYEEFRVYKYNMEEFVKIMLEYNF